MLLALDTSAFVSWSTILLMVIYYILKTFFMSGWISRARACEPFVERPWSMGMIIAFQAIGPGSSPGGRNFYFWNLETLDWSFGLTRHSIHRSV